jgi:dihydroflavonol-4-reductase
MRVFLTGGTGFLGSYVARQCLAAGHDVTALVRKNRPKRDSIHHSIRTVVGDLSTPEAIALGACDADAIVHCAADMRMSASIRKGWSVNTDGLTNLISAVRKSSLRKFVFISTANTLSGGTPHAPGDESLLKHPSDNDLPYVRSKRAAEHRLMNEFRESGLPACIIHPTFILGPGHSESTRLIRFMINRRLLVHTPGNKDIVDVRDVANAIVNAIHAGRAGERYLVSNESISYAELIEMVTSYSRRRVLKMAMPYPFWKIVGYSGSLLGATINHKTVELACQKHYYDSTKARRELSFSPRPVHETVHDTIAWLMNNAK